MFQPPPNPGTPVQCQKIPAVPAVFSPTAHTSVELTMNVVPEGTSIDASKSGGLKSPPDAIPMNRKRSTTQIWTKHWVDECTLVY